MPRCGGMARPHVLWFDESYDEPRFHFDSVLRLARRAAPSLLIIGTSASTNLPWHVVRLADGVGATLVDINIEDNPFGDIASRTGGVLRQPAAEAVPALVEHFVEYLGHRVG